MTRLIKEILEEQGLSKDQIDQRAEQLQRHGLPRGPQNFLKSALNEYRQGETLEAKIAYDAQLIDSGIQALLCPKTQAVPNQWWSSGFDLTPARVGECPSQEWVGHFELDPEAVVGFSDFLSAATSERREPGRKPND